MILGRGRNGYFEFYKCLVCAGMVVPKRVTFQVKPDDDHVTVGFMSKIRCKQPPISLEGPVKELCSLFQTILDDLNMLKERAKDESNGNG